MSYCFLIMDFSIYGVHKWILLIYLIKLLEVKGEVITLGTKMSTVVICIDKGEPLRFSNPFDPAAITDDSFVMLEWKKRSDNASDPTDISLMYITDPSGKEVISAGDRFSKYQFWGLQIDPVKYEDSGIYKATRLGTKKDMTVETRVVVASPPTLRSKALSMQVIKTPSEKIMMCGQLYDAGTPPVKMAIIADNGTALKSAYSNGYVSAKFDVKTETGEFSCGITETSPARECIAAEDIAKWDTSLNIGKSTSSADAPSLSFPTSSDHEDTTGVIAGIAAGIVILMIIIIVVLIVVKRRKRSRQEQTYNAKSEEAKVTDSGPRQSLFIHSDIDEDEEDPYNRSVTNRPYLPSKAASPYAVTGLKLGDVDNHYASTPTNRLTSNPDNHTPIYKEPPVVAPEGDSDDGTVQPKTPVRKDRNRNFSPGGKNDLDSRKSWAGVVDSVKEIQQHQQSQQEQQPPEPPVPMKRKNLTRSSDGLNLGDSRKGELSTLV